MIRLLLALACTMLVATPATAKSAPVEQARALMQAGKADEAIALLLAAVTKAPTDAAAHNLLGALFNNAGRYPQALTHAHAAAELEPANPRYRYNRGIVFAEHGRFDEALADFDFAIAKIPHEAPMYLERGAALLSLGRAADARRYWASARRLDPGLVWTDWYEGLHDLIDVDSDRAIPKLGKVALLQPGFDNAQAWLTAAYLIEGLPYVAKPVGDPWVRALLDFHASRRAFTDLLAVATSDQVTGDKRRIGEAWLHHGLKLQREGLLADARTAFATAAATPAPRHAWKLLAEAQLARQPK